jgi:hypothetical protein
MWSWFGEKAPLPDLNRLTGERPVVTWSLARIFGLFMPKGTLDFLILSDSFSKVLSKTLFDPLEKVALLKLYSNGLIHTSFSLSLPPAMPVEIVKFYFSTSSLFSSQSFVEYI